MNGFHDTANAVTTVVYSNSLQPDQAISVSIFCNFLGVLLGGNAVAFSLVFLLPKEMVAGINTINEASLVLALVLTSGVAGGVIGVKDTLQWSTLRAIIVTWFTTMPGCVVVAFAMGVILHSALV